MTGELLRVTGQVQGVGFRPTVWRIAMELGCRGDVRNTGDGVEIRLWGDPEAFIARLRSELPALAEIQSLERSPLAPLTDDGVHAVGGFEIAASSPTAMRASVTPDAAICDDCLAEIRDPGERRYRYPFANCTNCGPRFSIIRGAPYDRARTSMSVFEMCPACHTEYADPLDRRFHAQPAACDACGPRAWLEHLGDGPVNPDAFDTMDDVEAAGAAVRNGYIVAVRGVGGVHLACDATRPDVVERLRLRKQRRGKAFALMARDLDVIRQYAHVSAAEEALLTGPAAPIVLLRTTDKQLPDAVAPGLDRIGFMLPYSPLHHLMLEPLDRPVVMTSGNRSGQPQCTTNEETRERLAGIADVALLHDRAIVNRIDDSVARVDLDRPRLLRRARGYAPRPVALPKGFCRETQLLAMGSELKNTFCLVKDGQAVLSQHMGDLEDAATYDDVAHNLALYEALFQHRPSAIAVDRHPEYLSTKRGYEMAGERPVIEVQHHHAHIAACLVENGRALPAPPVLGIALDGLGLGTDGTLWGGEFLVAHYRGFKRAGCLKPVALPGGTAAVREPWRNLDAHLMAEMGWAELTQSFHGLEVYRRLAALPRQTLDSMIAGRTHAPLSSACGRLFDAASALAGLAWDAQSYEGEAAMVFEAAMDPAALDEPDDLAYPFTIPLLGGKGLPYIEPLAVWRAMLGDLALGTPAGDISARFHRGLAKAVVAMARRLTTRPGADGQTVREIDTVALSGGCFQNATLFRLVHEGLEAEGLAVLSHSDVPANDGGLALGQAAIALALTQLGDDHVPRHSRPHR